MGINSHPPTRSNAAMADENADPPSATRVTLEAFLESYPQLVRALRQRSRGGPPNALVWDLMPQWRLEQFLHGPKLLHLHSQLCASGWDDSAARGLIDIARCVRKIGQARLANLLDHRHCDVHRVLSDLPGGPAAVDAAMRDLASRQAAIAERKAAAARAVNAERDAAREAARHAHAQAVGALEQGFSSAVEATGRTLDLAQWDDWVERFSKPPFAIELTWAKAIDLGLSRDSARQLRAQIKTRKAAATIAKREAAQAARDQQQWVASLVRSWDMPEQLGCTKTEYDRWVEQGRLKPATHITFHKWGRVLQTPLFDPDFIRDLLDRDLLARWRSEDASVASANRRVSARKAAVTSKATRELKAALGVATYHDDFTEAREMKREWVALLGPTNSGKTHAAMTQLAAANSGSYLAPLRLLALEMFDR